MMKNNKLKKKTKHNQIIFPTTYLNSSKARDSVDKKIEKEQEKRYHRFLSKSKSQSKEKGSYQRSLSVNANYVEDKKIKLSKFKNSSEEKQEKQFLQKRFKRGTSAIQLSKIYYDHLQKKLQNECDAIMKQQHPSHHLKSYSIEVLSENLLRIKQMQNNKQIRSRKNLQKKTQVNFNTQKDLIDQKSQISVIQHNFMKDFDEYKQMTMNIISNIDISISGNQIQRSEPLIYEDYRHHSSLVNDIANSHQSQQSIFKSQANSNLIQVLEKTPIYFFSSKFSIKYTTFFRITFLKIIPNQEQKTFQMEIFFKMYNQVIFKRVSFRSMPEKKSDYRTRKGHIKRMQIIREKIKQRVLSNFMRQYSQELVIEFYQDLILYLEHFIVFQKTYRGLVFIDNGQKNLELKNHERIFEMLKINKSFYFILKLNYTFYIVKVIFSPQMELKFTFIYDFTTHNAGDQLFFTHPAPQKLKGNKNQAQTYKIFLKVINDFVDLMTAEWKFQQATNKQILQKESSAKISQITSVSLQKWDDPQVHKMSNINKQYHLIGDLTNFFVFHDHFDFGFFNKPHHLLVNGKYNYLLDQINKNIPVYVYPHTYIYLQLTQIQKQMIVIPHVSQTKYKKHTQKFINDFFHRQISKDYKKRHEFFTLFIGKKQIRMKQRLNNLDIYLHYSNNLRCQKISTPINQFPSYSIDQEEQLDLKKASSYIQKFVSKHKLEKHYLYSKFIQEQSTKLIIYHKGIQKLQRQFVFITLYGMPLHRIIQFKIFMFKLGREFIIRFDSIDWLKEINLKELIASLLQLIKSIYFKKLIQEQARKSNKRRLDTLENFLKKHGKSYVNQIRSKKKLDEQIKRRMMRLASFKDNNINTQVYQNIITDYFKLPSGNQCLITIRFVPSQEFREQNEWKSENIEICVHKEGSINYFKHISNMKQLVQSVSQGKLSIDHIDFRQIHNFFKQIRNKIKEIVKTSYKRMNFIISRLKHFLIYNYQIPLPKIYPFKFKLVQNIIYQTKNTTNKQDQIESQISIQLQMQKQANFTSNNNLIFLPYLGSEQRQQISTNFSFVCKKPVNHPYKRFIDQTHIIEIIDIFRKNDDYKLLKEYNLSNREIWITDRETGCRSILSDWDSGFLSTIDFGQYNNRLFRRLLKSLRPAL